MIQEGLEYLARSREMRLARRCVGWFRQIEAQLRQRDDQIGEVAKPKPLDRFTRAVAPSWQGNVPEPPTHWLTNEPGMTKVCQPGLQSTADRRVCRWHFDWHPRLEIT
jgi:hypothetical protein